MSATTGTARPLRPTRVASSDAVFPWLIVTAAVLAAAATTAVWVVGQVAEWVPVCTLRELPYERGVAALVQGVVERQDRAAGYPGECVDALALEQRAQDGCSGVLHDGWRVVRPLRFRARRSPDKRKPPPALHRRGRKIVCSISPVAVRR